MRIQHTDRNASELFTINNFHMRKRIPNFVCVQFQDMRQNTHLLHMDTHKIYVQSQLKSDFNVTNIHTSQLLEAGVTACDRLN